MEKENLYGHNTHLSIYSFSNPFVFAQLLQEGRLLVYMRLFDGVRHHMYNMSIGVRAIALKAEGNDFMKLTV